MRHNPIKTDMATPASTKKKDKKCNCKSLDVTNSKFHTNIRELLSQDRRNQFKMLGEFNQIEKMLDNREFKTTEQVKKARSKQRANPVAKLSNALHQYNTERISTENELISTIKKVNLDKTILFKEKTMTLWKDQQEQDQRVFEGILKKERAERYEHVLKQKSAYQKVLRFLKDRGTKPMQEEK